MGLGFRGRRWVAIADPVGLRSCCDPGDNPGLGGEWTLAGEPKAMLTDLERLSGLVSDLEFTMLRAELRKKFSRASQGKLRLTRNEHREEVVQSERQRRILEIRLNDRQERPPGTVAWKIRCYYSEPAHQQHMLLALAIRAKPPGRSGLDEQNRHMDEASDRLDDHYS